MNINEETQIEKLFDSYWAYSENCFNSMLANPSEEKLRWIKSVARFCFCAGLHAGNRPSVDSVAFWSENNETIRQIIEAEYLPDGP